MDNELELSNYWDDFEIRVEECIKSMRNGELPPLQRLTVHITDACNMRCKYCNMNFDKKTWKYMDVNLIKKIIDDYVAMGGSIIHFTGGEPTVHPHFFQITKYAKMQGLVVSSNTNALRSVCTDYVDKMKSSFDFADEDMFNDTVGVGAFETVVENMKQYSKDMDGKMLSITAVLNRKTYKHMVELAKFVSENFDVYNLYYSNYKGSNPEFAFTDAEIDDMYENYIDDTLQVFEDAGHEYSHRQLSLYKKDDFRNVEVRFPMNKTTPCYIQLSEMTIDVNGKCYNCSHLFRDGVEPPIDVNVSTTSLEGAFQALKVALRGNYTYMSKKCLDGCNCNLIGFNQMVHKNL